jgi:cytochrome P450
VEDALSEDEVFGTVVLLIVAGHETTVGLIGNAVLNLLEHPEQLALVREDPELLPASIEEVLRYEGPVERTLNRWAKTDVELGGRTIRRGELVIAIVGAADRDATRFAEAERLDVRREDVRHLAFGRGPHYCLGAPLARLEAQIALATLFRRLPGLRLAVPREELEWRPTPGFRRLVALPVAW